MGIIEKLILADYIQRIKLFSRIYLLIISVILTNIFLNKIGFVFNAEFDFSKGNIIHFLLSKEALVVMFYFIITSIFIFLLPNTIFQILSILIINIFKLIAYILELIKFLLVNKFKHFKLFKRERLIDYLIMAKVISIEENIIYQIRYFDIFKNVVQDLNDENNKIIENASILNTILISSYFIFCYYNINLFLHPYISVIFKWITIYWFSNTMVVLYIYRKREYLQSILLNSESLLDKITEKINSDEE